MTGHQNLVPHSLRLGVLADTAARSELVLDFLHATPVIHLPASLVVLSTLSVAAALAVACACATTRALGPIPTSTCTHPLTVQSHLSHLWMAWSTLQTTLADEASFVTGRRTMARNC